MTRREDGGAPDSREIVTPRGAGRARRAEEAESEEEGEVSDCEEEGEESGSEDETGVGQAESEEAQAGTVENFGDSDEDVAQDRNVGTSRDEEGWRTIGLDSPEKAGTALKALRQRNRQALRSRQNMMAPEAMAETGQSSRT